MQLKLSKYSFRYKLSVGLVGVQKDFFVVKVVIFCLCFGCLFVVLVSVLGSVCSCFKGTFNVVKSDV
jgi:hypothetical protein